MVIWFQYLMLEEERKVHDEFEGKRRLNKRRKESKNTGYRI